MTQNNLKVAITGGIGSGKSTVAQFIEEQGYKVVSCDEVHKSLLKDKKFLLKLSEEFGKDIISCGKLDRKKLASVVFSDTEKLKRLNKITHPIIMREALNGMAGSRVACCEVPLLFENGYEKYFDKVIVVLRNKEDRIAAVKKRDNITESEIEKRLYCQLDYDNCDFTKYYVIRNNKDLTDLYCRTIEILNDIVI